jgi:WD40 repeat protein
MPAPGRTTTLHEFAAHSTTVNCLALGPKTNQVREDSARSIIDDSTTTPPPVVVIVHHHRNTRAPLPSSHNPTPQQVLATGGEDRLVNVWRVENSANILSLSGQSSAITSLAFDAAEAMLASGSQGGSVKVFDLSTVRAIAC